MVNAANAKGYIQHLITKCSHDLVDRMAVCYIYFKVTTLFIKLAE